jgi:hypothetical protein
MASDLFQGSLRTLSEHGKMRLIPAFLLGLAAGAGAMIWLYAGGGELIVAGYELKPPPKIAPDVAVAPAPAAPRVVVRDITETAGRGGSTWPASPGNATATKTPPAGPANPPPSKVDNRGEFRVVIRYPR